MEFKEKKSIYIQIADFFFDNILKKIWQKEDKIPSVREMAVQLEVNPNTVMRAYAHLQDKGVIYNKRGIGYFVSPQAENEVKAMKKEDFMSNALPEFYKIVKLLDIDFRELAEGYKDFLKKELNNEDKH
ncbi:MULTISPECIES: GntR family transcriptional regulator [unclassified Oceanispirochaeta]|uniref:GntR family transcriptional regulator n=1 Tax=unclassified Oceanispirochaeta TaxID=2635722 RepID=UPI000E090BA4|nr:MULTISPECIES: GntR family transcriptional regulator [unclassified Oceanispirochaeta]MBF9017350.1 GntR family transcriptional regulator [Oceanispirochaeta sp. M2]NPD73725.1 GntR family transcriptional regulator [Oceanispirochaeta sp. M1]RDG30478.1 GntR family transcriptional regulator [Oceanispirochaeta sp. M1]